MKHLRTILIHFLVVALLAPALAAADSSIAIYRQLFGDVNKQLEAAREANAEVLSPDHFSRAMKYYKEAETNYNQRRNLDGVREDIAKAQDWLSKAMESTSVSGIAFATAMQTRKNALSADAPTHASQAWGRAEEALKDATRRVEDGDIRRAQEQARSVTELYQQAELQAIKTNYLSGARGLLKQAKEEKADRYATKTFIDAKLLLEQAERELTENRYDADYPRDLARRARNEAQHAITITRLAIGVNKKDFAVEDIITNYEKPLISIADELNIVPSLHDGYEPTRDAILQRVDVLQKESQELGQLRLVVDDHAAEIARLAALVKDYELKLGIYNEQLSQYNEQLAAEERYRALLAELENIFTEQEAEVFRQGKTLIVRMVGLNFDSNKSDLKTEHKRLLAKAVYAIQLAKSESATIEGHTDSHGGDDFNMKLSEARANAVVEYLKGEPTLANTQLQAVGYGETRPIANNESEAGRTKNRRIDVVIQLEREPAKAAASASAEPDASAAEPAATDSAPAPSTP
ncbi:MAG: OmpA family protein [Alcanivoracaceae bacterium]|nr:OmpA family protein [Alcanivoracaceae bacterium]